MSIFDIYLQLIPLVLLAICGFWSGKQNLIQKEQIFSLIYYIFAPILVFHNTLKVNVFQNYSLLILFFLFLFISCLVYIISYFIYNKPKKDAQSSAFALGSTNSGYFGLPLIILTLGTDYEIYGVVCLLAYFIFESLLGFGNLDWKNYLKVPNLIAFVIGTSLSSLMDFSGLISFKAYQETISYGRYAFVIFGMLLLGISISEIKFDLRLLVKSVIAVLIRGFLWVVFGLVLALMLFKIGYISKELYLSIAILSLTPISVNSILVCLKKESSLDFISMSVLISTIFSVIIIPFLIPIIFGFIG